MPDISANPTIGEQVAAMLKGDGVLFAPDQHRNVIRKQNELLGRALLMLDKAALIVELNEARAK